MEFVKQIKIKAKKLKQEILAIYFAFRDKRTPWYAKLFIALTLSYALSPIDLIPDFIPVIGYLDDLIILPLLIIVSIKLIPKKILDDSRDKAKKEEKLNKKIGIPAAVFIVVFWSFIIGLIVYKICIKNDNIN